MPIDPARSGPTAAPIDPVPSMTDVTVANAFPDPYNIITDRFDTKLFYVLDYYKVFDGSILITRP